MEKYELTDDTIEVAGRTLHRIRALTSFANVQKGDLGGYIESKKNLGTTGNCWIYDNAKVYGNAMVLGDSAVCNNAEVFDYAIIDMNARILDEAKVCGRAIIYRNATVSVMAKVYGYARVKVEATVTDEAIVTGKTCVYGNARVGDNAKIDGEATIGGEAYIFGNAQITGTANVKSVTQIGGNAVIRYTTDYLTIQGITKDSITFHKSDDEIKIYSKYYCGSLDNFRKQAFEIPQDNIVKELLLLAKLAEYHFENQN